MWHVLIELGESKWRKRKRTYLLKKMVGSLGKRVKRVDVILGEIINKCSLEESCQLLFPFLVLWIRQCWSTSPATELVLSCHLKFFYLLMVPPVMALRVYSFPTGVRKVIASVSYLPCQIWESLQCSCLWLWLLNRILLVVCFRDLQKASQVKSSRRKWP